VKDISKGSGEPYITPLEEHTDYPCFIKDITWKEGVYKGKSTQSGIVKFVTQESYKTDQECYISGYFISPKIPKFGEANEWDKYVNSKQDKLFKALGKDKLKEVRTVFGGKELESQEDMDSLCAYISNTLLIVTTGEHGVVDEDHVYANVSSFKPMKQSVVETTPAKAASKKPAKKTTVQELVEAGEDE
jgi:hypothetical protein